MKNITNKTTLKVTDFGPIGKAEIDLRPLTVFLGPSNAGKSYLAILIYALHRNLSESDSSFRDGILSNRWLHFDFDELLFDTDNFKKHDTDKFIKWTKELGEKLNLSLFSKDGKSPKKHSHKNNGGRAIIISDIVIRLLRRVFETQATTFAEELSRSFALEPDDLKRKFSQENPKISINYQASVDSVKQSFDLFFNPVENKLKSNFSKEFQIVFNEERFKLFTIILTKFLRKLIIIEDDDNKEILQKYFIAEFISTFSKIVHLTLTDSLSYPAYYLPAGRTGIMHVHNVVVSAFFQNATKPVNSHENSIPTLSGVSADFMGGLISINPRKDPRKTKHEYQTNQIEDITEGKVHIEQEEVSNYPRFTYQPEGWTENLPMKNASSMVSELAPVVFYLRYKVNSGNVLIIEEPESHLHPAKQVEFINAIAALIKSGIRVIITTHSQWILEGLSNVVQRSQLATAEQKSSTDEIALNPEMVGLWLFKKNAKTGSTVDEIKFDDNMYASDFGDVAKNLYNDWVDLVENGRME